MTTDTQKEREQALAALREALPPGTTVRTILRHVSSSGMTRWISVVHDDEDISYLVARILNTKANQGKHEGIKRTGCGMDMGFDLVYSLSRHLYPSGFDCIGSDNRCPSNDHSNRNPSTNHPEGGYALNQRWL